MTIITIDEAGNLTLPPDVRRSMGIDGAAELEIVEQDGAVTLRARSEEDDDDSWLYTPESIARIKRAEEDVRAGRVYDLSREELLRAAGGDIG